MRRLTENEFAVCAKLISNTRNSKKLMSQLETATIDLLPDGGMGSMRFVIFGKEEGRKFGNKVAEAKALDSDGIPLFFSLLVDEEGNLFELEIWRVDFNEIRQFPGASNLELI